MKAFISKVTSFLAVLLLLTVVGVLLPPTPRASTSHIFAKLKMDSLLKHVKSPRLILVGGSNLSLSINSQLLKDSSGLYPINTGISWDIGLLYMFDNTLKYVKEGDIVIASMEYNQFFNNVIFGGEDLVRTIFDVSPNEFFQLRFRQIFNIAPHIPYYAFSKFNPKEYLFTRDPFEIYDRNATNQYGDNCKHWNLASRKVRPIEPLPLTLNEYALDILSRFESDIQHKGATLYLTFPALQQTSFELEKTKIKAIENELRRRDLFLIGTPERYVIPDTLIFDTPYHLTKTGVDLRTRLLIEDLKLVTTPPLFVDYRSDRVHAQSRIEQTLEANE
ncbi:MAG TPA: hypothetical protein VJ184_09335 [Chryseolinea sp.]|nr:hypothetical protein [Chryseolinea sp.]